MTSYRQHVDQKLDDIEAGNRPARIPLSAGQHILHLLLTVFTAGLWSPVWVIRTIQGNKRYLKD